ncbi:hypothetical protein Tco_0106929, partial [Tanacetum coccineum]
MMPLPLLLNKSNHISSMHEAYNRNQEAPISLMQTQMGQFEEAFQERPLSVLPSDTETYPREERKAVTTMDDLTLDGSFIPHSNFLFCQEKEQEPKTITEVVEIPSSQSTPLVPPSETPPLSIPKPKENLEPNPQSFRESYGTGNPTPSYDFVIESLSSLPTPFGDSDSLVEETAILLSHFNDSSHDYETFCFDIEEKSSGSTTSRSYHSLPDYDVFYFDNDHFSLPEYDSFILDLSIDPFPPADMSVSHQEEFVDELAHTIFPPEY